jgi:hypothetical protein
VLDTRRLGRSTYAA